MVNRPWLKTLLLFALLLTLASGCGLPLPTRQPEPTLPAGVVPAFSHVFLIVFENHEFDEVIGHPEMPYFNQLAGEYTLLTQHYAIRHPSLPNYIALISGDTHGITRNCKDCFIDAPNLPDRLEEAGYTWRTYQEGLPEPCFVGSAGDYAQKHNPFVYFDDIRLNAERCRSGVLPLTDLENDLQTGQVADFVFITPDLCNSGHDCEISQVDDWIKDWTQRILASTAFDERSLLVLTWDEGVGDQGCCGLREPAGGRVATVLVSDLVQPGFQDDTPYTHYSILKTLSAAWGLSPLGHAADVDTQLITAPWAATTR